MSSASRVSNVTDVLDVLIGHTYICAYVYTCICLCMLTIVLQVPECKEVSNMCVSLLHVCWAVATGVVTYPCLITGTTEQAIAQREFVVDSRRYRYKHTRPKDRAEG
jgi:hypothetical protein